jgi:alkanesulfonate monooxygenase
MLHNPRVVMVPGNEPETGCAMNDYPSDDLRLFTTCPPSAMADRDDCLLRLQQVSRWSEDAGCEGMLVFSDNRQLDPWLVSQAIIDATSRLCPLVAVQPAYMHPYTVAKMISSMAFLYRRRMYLNMVAGGFRNDLVALNDPTPHDERYARLVEYTSIVQNLLGKTDSFSFGGRYYEISNLKLTPSLPPSLLPGILVSGSSKAGMNAARQLDATPVEYPRPAREYKASRKASTDDRGIRIGVIARESDAEAWSVARKRFPEDRKGQLTRKMASKVSDSQWHKQLSEADDAAEQGEPYWLGPFNNYKAMCPYLVGSYDRIATEIGNYVAAGYRTFILDEPENESDLQQTGEVFKRAEQNLIAA